MKVHLIFKTTKGKLVKACGMPHGDESGPPPAVQKKIEAKRKKKRKGAKMEEAEKAMPETPTKGEPLPTGAHRTPPKGYPKKKSDYAIPSEYKYPLDTEKHVRAAISYFSKPANASMYTSSEQKAIWGRIKAKAKKMGIETGKKSGPPSVEKETNKSVDNYRPYGLMFSK